MSAWSSLGVRVASDSSRTAAGSRSTGTVTPVRNVSQSTDADSSAPRPSRASANAAASRLVVPSSKALASTEAVPSRPSGSCAAPASSSSAALAMS